MDGYTRPTRATRPIRLARHSRPTRLTRPTRLIRPTRRDLKMLKLWIYFVAFHMLFNRGRNHLQFIVGISPVSPQIHLKAIGNLESGKFSVAKYTTHNMERAGRYNFRSYHWLVKLVSNHCNCILVWVCSEMSFPVQLLFIVYEYVG